MTMTMQDAQHVSWKIFNKISSRLEAERGKAWDLFVIVADLLEESGRVAAVVKDLEGVKPAEKPESKETLAKELNNLLYSVFVLAERYGINLEETYLEQVNDHLLKFLT